MEIVDILLADPAYKSFMRETIFSKLKTIGSYHDTDMVFLALEKMEPFSPEECKLIITEYDGNNQISGARSADTLVQMLRNK